MLEVKFRSGKPRQRPDSTGCSPLSLLLGRPVLLNQLAVTLLQLSRRHVQLLIDFGVLVVDLPQQLHLLVQVLEETRSDVACQQRGQRLSLKVCFHPQQHHMIQADS